MDRANTKNDYSHSDTFKRDEGQMESWDTKSKKMTNTGGKRKKSDVRRRFPADKEECLESSRVSLPQIVPYEEGDEKGEDNVPQNESTFSLNKFSQLPPIQSDTNSLRATVLESKQNLTVIRKRLPPIRKLPTDEKPESNKKKSDSSSNQKKEKRSTAFSMDKFREMKNKERLDRHAKKRREALEAWAIEQSLKIEKHVNKLNKAERNKEQLRQQRKRKLECEEEKRRRAKERVNSYNKLGRLLLAILSSLYFSKSENNI